MIPISYGAYYDYEYEYQVSHNNADALRSGLNYYRNIYQNKITNNSEQCTLGMVFDNTQIPKDTVITNARLELDIRDWDQAWVKQWGLWVIAPTSYRIWGYEAIGSDNFGDWADFLGKMAGPRTSYQHFIKWQHSGWDTGWIEWDVTNIVQEIVSTAGWGVGQNITLFIENSVPSPFRSAKQWVTWGLSHDFAPEFAPKLIISTSEPLTISDFDNDPTISGSGLGISSYRVQTSNTFFSNYTESFWCIGNLYDNKYISESVRENNFANWTQLMNQNPSGWNFDIWLEPNGRYFWIGYNNATGLYCRKGELHLTGNSSYTWLASAQFLEPYNQGGRMRIHHGGSIVTSKSGNPFIWWCKYDTTYSSTNAYIIWTDLTNGTWGNKYVRVLGDVANGGYWTQVSGMMLPSDTEFGVYCIWSDTLTTPVREATVGLHNDATVITDTGSWRYLGGLITDGYTYDLTRGFYKWDASSNFKGFLAFIGVDDDGSPPTQLLFRYRNGSSASHSWSSSYEIMDARSQNRDDRIIPNVVVDEHNNSLVMWITRPINERSDELTGNKTIYYKIRWNNGTWSDTVQWKNLTHTVTNEMGRIFDEEMNFDVVYNNKDYRANYSIRSYGTILTTTYNSHISDTWIDTGLNKWNEKLWLVDNLTDSGGFYNMSYRFRHSTTYMYRINTGADQWVYSPFLASTRFENFTTDSGGNLSRVVGLISYHNSGNDGGYVWRWGLYARNGSTIVTDLAPSWKEGAQTHYIDVRLFAHNNSIIARFYSDLTFTTEIYNLTITDASVIYGVYNYTWGLHMRYVANLDYGIDVSGLFSLSESNEPIAIGMSDALRSPISIVWNTAGNYWGYHDYIFINSSLQQFFGSPFYSDMNHTTDFANTDCNFTITWDDTLLDSYIFSWNGSGVWVNDTAINFISTPQDIFVEKTLPPTEGTVVGYMFYANNTDGFWNETIVQTLTTTIPVSHLNTTLSTGVNGAVLVGYGAENEWVFMGERYYFTSYVSGATTFKLYFNDGYDIHTINFKWDNTTKVLSTDNDENDEFVTGLFYSDYELTGFTHKIIWGWIPDKNIVDDWNVTVSYELYNEASNTTITNSTGITFRLHNLGGFGQYDHTNRGKTGRLEGGDQFEIWNSGWFYSGESDEVNATGIWRRLQAIHTTFSFYRQRPYVGGYYTSITSDDDRIYFGIDYYENGSWINVLEVRITIEDSGLVGRGGLNADSSYDVLNVTWWTQGVMEKQDIITVYNHGYSFYGDEPNNRTYNRLWLDLWFNKLNSSTVVGGRIAPYYNGMWEWDANPFWFGYGDFAPFFTNNSAETSIYYTILKNSTGSIRSCYGLEVMRFYDGIRKTDDFLGYLWQIQDFQIFDVNLADDRMEGIDTPIFVEPENPSMPKGGGFLQPLVNAINGISTMITKSIFNLIKLLMGAVGSFMHMIGLGEWWDSFSIMLNNIATFSLQIMEGLQLALVNTAELLNQILRMVSSGLTRYTATVTAFITSILSWYTAIIQMFSGGGVWSINIWMSLSLGDWFGLLITLSPVLWIQRLANADDLVSTMQSDISFMLMLVTGLFNFLSTVIILAISLMSFLLGLLPI